ncbi:MAG: tetraacyldisaccharide 4'-kinase [Micavibrio aeruginosavorus]|uniref:Tetraacyldisaccharide 4'-kinase n=1 Tax=Micavibrio aeruginosavorus TaxID=349221 RepID=A0A2W5MSM2_9BACT|nr:MAG: tetraacyldisaccharide 4'-kinase [Micavibrio aeruginosavorus]
MPPKAPAFWEKRSFLAWGLTPISVIYYFAHIIKTLMTRPYKSALPVICVGGVAAGGSGKTPTVHALVKIAFDKLGFINPVILTRGYGGDMEGPSVVDLSIHTYGDVGDEALLHAMHAQTIVSRDRAAGVILAEAMGADLVIMDDGLQNNSIKKRISFLVIDQIGNGFMLPAGPLREPMKDALKKCSAVILTGKAQIPTTEKPIIHAETHISSSPDKSLAYYGFAGLGRPEKFRQTLLDAGLTLSGFRSFPDHHPYDDADLNILFESAKNAQLITTEKDYTRIPAEYRDRISVLPIEYRFEEESALIKLLEKIRP